MNITLGWLKEKSACSEGVMWFKTNNESDGIKVIESLIKDNKLQWANWTIVRLMTHKQQIQYAVYAAEQVIELFEKKYPEDKRPRQAIDAAKLCIENPTDKNKKAAFFVAYVANAANAADAADAAAFAAAYAAAYAAADAADAAAYAGATAAAYAGANAANAAADAADAAAFAGATATNAYYVATDAKMKVKILEYGISLLKGE